MTLCFRERLRAALAPAPRISLAGHPRRGARRHRLLHGGGAGSCEKQQRLLWARRLAALSQLRRNAPMGDRDRVERTPRVEHHQLDVRRSRAGSSFKRALHRWYVRCLGGQDFPRPMSKMKANIPPTKARKHKREVWRKGEKPVLVLGVNTGLGFSAAWAANTLRATCALASSHPRQSLEVTVSNAYF